MTFDELRDRTGLSSAPSNPSGCLSDDQRTHLEQLRLAASAAAKEYMIGQRQQRAADMRTAIADNLRSLKTWGDARIELLEQEKYTKSKDGKLIRSQVRVKRAEQDIQRTKDLLEQRREWIQQGFMTAPEPYLRLAAVFTSSAS